MPRLTLRVLNGFGGPASITVACQQTGLAPIWTRWDDVPADTSTGAWDLPFDPDHSDGYVAWYVSAAVASGPNAGIHESRGSRARPATLGRLMDEDDGAAVTLSFGPRRFIGQFADGRLTGAVSKTGPYNRQIRHVFVLMLENRSFDQILGWSGHTGPSAQGGAQVAVTGPPAGNKNSYTNDQGRNISVPVSMVSPNQMHLSADPGHEFPDVLEQLCGAGAQLGPHGEYPAMTATGFATSYAKALAKIGVDVSGNINQIMSGVGPNPAPLVLQQLMNSYAVCDNWFSAVPGPTWPNRFFAMAGTSAGLEVSPNKGQLFASEYLRGFTLGNGPIFTALRRKGLSYRIYKDYNNLFADNPAGTLGMGWQTIAAGVTGIHRSEVQVFDTFTEDLQGAYPHQFTFIEPNYGDSGGDTYQGGSSQHPMDGLLGGERLIKATYEAIRNSPLWEHSLLIITYDETGGTYDHVLPPATVAPDALRTYSKTTFDFKTMGPRVPAVIVSPWVTQGMIDKRQYDHTSIISTTMALFGGGDHLTARDQAAATLLDLMREPIPRPGASCPTTVTVPDMPPTRRSAEALTLAVAPSDPLPDAGTIIAFLGLAAQIDFGLSDGSDGAAAAIGARLGRLNTYADATAYITDVYRRDAADARAGDLIDDVLTGEASDADRSATAGQMSLSLADLDRLRAQAMAAGLMRRLPPPGPDRTRIRQQIEAFEFAGTELGDDDDYGFYVPPGTSALLRLWS